MYIGLSVNRRIALITWLLVIGRRAARYRVEPWLAVLDRAATRDETSG